ncbi:MAG: SLBB domain-containing protein [Bacteroidota bacterium]
MKKIFLFILIATSVSLYAQVKDYELGSANRQRQSQGAYYDYSEPQSLNIKVSVWGFVRYPGRYVIPISTTTSDLLSYAGGPTDDAVLEDLRLYSVKSDGSEEMVKFSYNDLLWENTLTSSKERAPNLSAGDILIVPGDPRLYFKDWYSLTLSTISTLLSVTTLIFVILR